MKLNLYLLKSTVVAALGGLLFGFDTAVIAGTTHALTDTFNLSPAALGLTVSVALWGTILGSMFAGIPGDKIGRRDSLRAMAVLYLVSALGCALAWNWFALVLFRFIGGLASVALPFLVRCILRRLRPLSGEAVSWVCFSSTLSSEFSSPISRTTLWERCSLALLNGGGSLGFPQYPPSCSFCFSSVSLVAPVGWSKRKEWPRGARYFVCLAKKIMHR